MFPSALLATLSGFLSPFSRLSASVCSWIFLLVLFLIERTQREQITSLLLLAAPLAYTTRGLTDSFIVSEDSWSAETFRTSHAAAAVQDTAPALQNHWLQESFKQVTFLAVLHYNGNICFFSNPGQ